MKLNLIRLFKGNFLLVILGVTVLVLVVLNLRCHLCLKNLETSLPCLTKGEKLPDFSLIDLNSRKFNVNTIKTGVPIVIFIFQRPCVICNKNIIFWRQIASTLSKKAKIIGVLLENHIDVIRFHDSARLNFELYIPENDRDFIKKFRMIFNMAQTIVIKNGRVAYIKLGNLDPENAISIMEDIKDVNKS